WSITSGRVRALTSAALLWTEARKIESPRPDPRTTGIDSHHLAPVVHEDPAAGQLHRRRIAEGNRIATGRADRIRGARAHRSDVEIASRIRLHDSSVDAGHSSTRGTTEEEAPVGERQQRSAVAEIVVLQVIPGAAVVVRGC